jgi:hypothetical protein
MSEELRTIIREELAPLRVHIDGIPLIARKLTVVDQNVRMLRDDVLSRLQQRNME